MGSSTLGISAKSLHTPLQPSNGKASVAVLFARRRSIYKSIPWLDVWDEIRDARNYDGRLPVVAHPPCRAWGRLKGQAKPRSDERELAICAVEHVRRCGGVLEHPAYSDLWQSAGLPRPGNRDVVGGWTLPILQSWFGHRAPKATWLYLVGVEPADLPEIPFSLATAIGRVEMMGQAEREKTPFELAKWLVSVAFIAGNRP